jgi:aldose 1-epimerase
MNDSTARSISAGYLEAIFLPSRGMLCASLRHKGEEFLRRIEDLDAAAAKGSTAGIPLLYPWANRLAGHRYSIGERKVSLDPSSPLLHFEDHGLPMHGVPWGLLAWDVIEAKTNSLSARLDWTRSDLLAIFPFRHRIEMITIIGSDGLTLETKVNAILGDPVPISFGFHPYFGVPEIPREEWQLQLPAMQRLKLDNRGIPTGEEEPFEEFDSKLNQLSFDDGFAVTREQSSFAIVGAGRRIAVDLIAGYRYIQIFAPKEKDYVALEPMTAPTNALSSGRGLRYVHPGESFTAAFRIRIEQF